MHLELIKAEEPDALEESVEMVQEPAPDLTRGDTVSRGRIRADCVVDGREMGEVANGAGLLWRKVGGTRTDGVGLNG